jgi:hypothetical protein
MHMRSRLRLPRSLFLTIPFVFVAVLAGPSALPAQGKSPDHYALVILNDGYVLQGDIQRENTVTDVDAVTQTPFTVPKGFFLVDDGPRRIVFSPKQVRVTTKMDKPIDDRLDFGPPPIVFGKKMPPVAEVVDAGGWNANLERQFKFRTIPGGPLAELKQRIGTATTYFVRVDSTEKCSWGSVYLTRELRPDELQNVVRSNPQIQEKVGMAADEIVARRFRSADFFTRTGYYENAEEELQHLVKDFPAQKERAAERQTAIAKLRAREDFEEIKRRHQAGQYSEVRKRLKDFPEKNVPEDTLASFRELKGDYEGVEERSKLAGQYLDALLKDVDPKYAALFKDAAKAMKEEFYFDSLARLETFLSQAKQAEKSRKAGKKPDLDPAELVALAVTGWMLGNGAAEATPGVAVHLLRTRQMLIEYIRLVGVEKRKKLLEDYLADNLKDSVSAGNAAAVIDNIARIIPLLPPVEPEEDTTTKPKTLKLGRGPNARTYDVQLPPEYRHSRPCPVLIVLHKEGETPAAALKNWEEHAAENGYILAAPEWEGRQGGYTYGDSGEHEILVETLRDLRRRFQVDSDRVFLFGQGQGANMAHDVGLSHPDLFAGVSSMGVNPEFHSMGYWRNGQYLPFYVVTGTNSGKNEEHVHDLFEHWVGKHFPMLWVTYKGRGADWFGGEVPNIFDWMRNKRRAFPMHQLGTDGLGGPFGTEFFTVRPTDNSFYWITSDKIDPAKCFASYKLWKKTDTAPRVTAIVDPKGNEIRISRQGMNQLTVWLCRNAKGESLIDFDKELTVRVDLGKVVRVKPETMKPSARVLLEDFYDRGDRQRLFLQKIDVLP